jgi:hypothetical protein
MEKYNNTTTIQEQKQEEQKQTYNCSKCNKEYLTLKYAKNHEDKCIGIDNLTCPKCMKSFSTRQHKSTHIKNNNCKARSIVYAKKPAQTQYDYINNYGSERLDYIKADEMLKFIYEHSKSLHLFIEKKYFNKNFPENHNIKKVDEKCYKVKEDGEWKSYHISLLSFKLVEDNVKCLLDYYNKNDLDKYEEFREDLKQKLHELIFIRTSSKFKQIVKDVKYLLKVI